MLDKFKSILASPVFADEGKTSIARYVHNLTLWALGLMTIYGISLGLFVPFMAVRALTILPLAASLGLILIWNRQGRVKLASIGALTVFWLFFAMASAWSGGIRSIPFSGNILVVLTAAMLWGQRTALIYAVLCLASGVILIVAETNGLLPPLATTPVSAFLLQGAFFLAGAGSLYLGTYSIREALERAERELAERRRAEQSLRDSETIYRRAIEAIGGVPYLNDYKLHKYTYIGEGIRSMTGYAPDEITPGLWGKMIQEYTLLGEAHGLDRPEAIRRALAGELKYWQTDSRILTKDGRTRWIMDSAIQILDDAGKPFSSIGILLDVSSRKQAEEESKRLAQQTQRRADQLATLNQVSRAVSTLRDLDDVLETIYEQARRSLPLDVFFIGLYDADANQISFPIMYDDGKKWDESRWRKLNPDSLSGRTIQSGSPLLINQIEDMLADPSLVVNRIGDASRRSTSLIIAPLPSGERTVGVISVQSYTRNVYHQDDLNLLVGIAYQAAIAIENARLYTSVQQELVQRQQAEHRLFLSERRFRAIIENVSDGVVVLDGDGAISYASPADESITGYPASERLAHAFLQVVDEPDRESFQSIFNICANQPNLSVPFTVRLRRQDNSVRWVEGTGINMLAEPAVEGILVHYRDITERKQAEESIRSNLVWRNAILDNSPDMTWLMDDQYRYIAVNQVFAKAIRQLAEDVIGKDDFSIWKPKSAAKYRATDEQAMRTRQRLYVEDHFTDRNGRERWFETIKTPIMNARGETIGITGTSREITERKQAEAEREKLIRELESRNAELERFTYTVSHDLKSPIVTIQGFLGYIEQDAQSGNVARIKEDLGRITTATQKMMRLLNELLELSRIGRMMNPPVQVAFNEIVREALELEHGRLSGTHVRVTIAEQMPTVHGDRARLVQVMQNLIDNAAKFSSDQPEPRIDIGVRGADPGGKPIFFVRDNGIGIDPQFHERVFGLFNKLDARSEGTGVGLAVVKRIIEVHGGRIWIESQGKGHGTTFCFTLAVKENPASDIASDQVLNQE